MGPPAVAAMTRRLLFDGELLRIGHITAQPVSDACGEIESSPLNVVALTTAGVFAKHDGPRQHVIASPNHAIFIAADRPYRLSFPGRVGDRCLTLGLTDAALAQVMPQAMSRDRMHVAPQALLSPSVMLARNLLCRRLRAGEPDPLEVEEMGIGLLVATLGAAREERTGRETVARDAARRLRQIERVKEAIAVSPERKWTLAGLADLACVSPHHLAHVFRRDVGVSVYHYVLRSRLARSLGEVIDADTEFTKLALDAGFANPSHFTARFRAFFGLTPTELRRSRRTTTATQLRKIVTAPLATAA